MSLIDEFEDDFEPIHIRSCDPETARRQFRISLILVAAMAVAAFILGLALPLNATHARLGKPVASDNTSFSSRLAISDEH